jgi:8-oxo-dGTP diphosphatase
LSVKADLVSGILPVRPDGRMLLLQRPTGTWEPPAGRLAPGETFERGATRELYEETGLLVRPRHILATWVGRRPGGGCLAAATYVARVEYADVRISHEHLDLRWATVDEWLELPSWWSREDIRAVRAKVADLPAEPDPVPKAPPPPPSGVVEANLGAGSVLVDLAGAEPRALLMRRRKPPAGLWENPGGMLEEDEDFVACARRETLEETGLDAEPVRPWWARIDPWRGPDDPELYAGVGFVSVHDGGEVRLEDAAHDAYLWATETEWRSLRTWYTREESDALWHTIRRLGGGSH